MLIDDIREVLKQDHVTFTELSRIEGFSGGGLTWSIRNEKISNVVIWVDMTREAVDAIETIIAEGKYEMVPTTPLTYLIDGSMLKLPLAKSVRHYKKEHWVPTIFKKKPRRGRN